MLDLNSIDTLHNLYEELKFWGTFFTVTFGIYKGWSSLKKAVNEDIPAIHVRLDTMATKLEAQTEQMERSAKSQSEQMDRNAKSMSVTMAAGLKEQTNAFVNELRELRQDFRTFYVPQMAVLAKPPGKVRRVKAEPTSKAASKQSSQGL